MSSQFYIVATPIGNREDITTRAQHILGQVDFIVAEDTRHTGQLLAMYGIKKPLLSFRDAPQPVMDKLLNAVRERLAAGESGAYVTDAGTPGVSDPAWRIVQAAIQMDVSVSPLPGPAAVTALLSVADAPIDEYRFVGFLPKKKGFQTKIADLLDYLNHKEQRAVLFYESPNRIRATLQTFFDCHCEARSNLDVSSRAVREISGLHAIIGRELTKKFETIYRSELTKDFIATLPEKGEYVVMVLC